MTKPGADQINVQDGVDFAETLDQFLQLQLVTLAQFVWTTPESEFSRGFYDLCQKFLADITNLSVRCFSDGQTSLERLVRNQVGSRNPHTELFLDYIYRLFFSPIFGNKHSRISETLSLEESLKEFF